MPSCQTESYRVPFLPLLAPCSSSPPFGFHGNRPISLVITPHISYSPARWVVYIGVWHVCDCICVRRQCGGRRMSPLKVNPIVWSVLFHWVLIHRDHFLRYLHWHAEIIWDTDTTMFVFFLNCNLILNQKPTHLSLKSITYQWLVRELNKIRCKEMVSPPNVVKHQHAK